MVYQNDDNYVKLCRIYLESSSGNVFQFGEEVGGTYSDQSSSDSISSTTVYLKITKSGTNYLAYFSADGATYNKVGTAQSVTLSPIKVGVFATNGTQTATSLNVDFDYFNIN
jgi:regulation of enolase protein 1 (concanavalin A-like superfamily)